MQLPNDTPIKVEVSHTLSNEQLSQISDQVYKTTLEAIERARKASGIDNDILYSKADLRRFLNNCSAEYVEELLADETFPRGRTLSERKQCFSKIAIKKWLLDNNKK